MKQKDTLLVIVCVIIAAVLSILLSSKFIGGTANRQQKVEVISSISSEFNLPDNSVFNSEAVNPTKLIEIAPNTNNQPFANQ